MIDYARQRQAMVDSQIRVNDVTDPRILAAMGELPREKFVPAARAALAYIDEDVPLRATVAGKPARYLMEPMVLARLVQAAPAAIRQRSWRGWPQASSRWKKTPNSCRSRRGFLPRSALLT
jgi:hypothetical protein